MALVWSLVLPSPATCGFFNVRSVRSWISNPRTRRRFVGTEPAAILDDADHFRRQAEECRQLAARAPKAADKVFWLRLAEDWLELAQKADKPTKGPL